MILKVSGLTHPQYYYPLIYVKKYNVLWQWGTKINRTTNRVEFFGRAVHIRLLFSKQKGESGILNHWPNTHENQHRSWALWRNIQIYFLNGSETVFPEGLETIGNNLFQVPEGNKLYIFLIKLMKMTVNIKQHTKLVLDATIWLNFLIIKY